MDHPRPVALRVHSFFKTLDSERVFAFIFASTLALMLVPIWATQWLPLQDLGGHIELMEIMHRHSDGTLPFQETYTLPGWFDANSLSLGAAWLLSPLFGTLAVAKLLLSFYVVGLPLSILATARAFGRSPWLALIGTPFVFNALLNVGFINYLIALPLIFWMVPLAKKLAEREKRLDALLFGTCALLLFYAHVIGFLIGWAMGMFVLLVYGKRRQWMIGLIVTLPTLLLLSVWIERMFLNPVATELGRTFGTDGGLAVTYTPLERKLGSFHMWGTNFFRDSLDEIVLIVMSIVWTISFTQHSLKNPALSEQSRLQVVRRYGLEIITVICFIAYLLLPSGANEIAILAERVPIMVMTFLLLWPRTAFQTKLMQWVLVPAVIGAMTYPLLVHQRFSEFERQEVGDLQEVISTMKKGTKVAYVLSVPTSNRTYMKPLWHIPKAQHAITNGGITHDSFAIRPYTPIQYKPSQSPTRVKARFEKTASVYEFDYVLLQKNKIPTHMFHRKGVDFILNKGPWWLFSISDPDVHANVITSPGRGGFQDRFDCPQESFISGLSGQRLSVIGNVISYCQHPPHHFSVNSDIDGSGNNRPRASSGPFFGRKMKASKQWEVVCGKGEAIVGLRGYHDGYLRSLEIVCSSTRENGNPDYSLNAVPHAKPPNFNIRCPKGTFAIGYRGRSGLFIDQIGLKCGPL